MAYNPLNWQSGDIVTAEKLNQMRGGLFIITPVEEGGVTSLGYSYQDLMAMLENGVVPALDWVSEGYYHELVYDLEYGYVEEYGCFVRFAGYSFAAQTVTDILIKD